MLTRLLPFQIFSPAQHSASSQMPSQVTSGRYEVSATQSAALWVRAQCSSILHK